MVIMRLGESACDARCHDAKGATCRCICNGKYHGVGARAMEKLHEDIRDGAYGPDLARILDAYEDGFQVRMF